ncbi:MAG: serine protease [Acidobacteria bacterium]|nr:serine protease [Acidobacteriota bacterium]
MIGHPEGGTPSLSIHDNLLLNYDGRWVHCRAPTKGGSSGSPVFNQDWEFMALPHAAVGVPASGGKPGEYEANEGIWIQSIRQALASA